MFFEQAILLAFAITVISEASIILAIFRPREVWFWVIGIILINSLTHPLAIYFLRVQNMPYIPIEFGVIIVEAIWYNFGFKISWRRAIVISMVANVFSILAGAVVRILFL